jgi:spermidine/putrescine transport system ATP-binding protein
MPLDGAAPAEATFGMEEPTLIAAKGVTKRFDTGSGPIKALDDVSLDVRHNEFFTLLGPSGCGKSTLLRMLAGFEYPDTGKILLEGRPITDDPPNKRPVNIVFQSYALFPHMSVGRNVAFGLERQGLPRQRIAARVAAMLALVRLDDMADRMPAQLSGGQQQRVALARALAPEPKLLLLDEPMSALDRQLRRGMQIELKRMQRETGIAFLLVTHDQEEALSMSDRIAVMQDGRVLQTGTPRGIYEAPLSRFVADFMGANVLPGSLLGLKAPYAAVRPETIRVTASGTTDAWSLPGRVKDVTYLGATTSCVIALDSGPDVKVDGADGEFLAPDAAVRCVFSRDDLALLDT